MKKEYELILFGNRVRHLIDILGLKKGTYLDCILISYTNNFNCFSYERNNWCKHKEYRITKADIKRIKLIYDITGDRETALIHLFED